ncbi:MAG TPA: PAS domain-containing protein [Desulfobacteraceae bacterium]|nr:PAS domain-containing protein [Desulfobacteraceae bacterium]
MTINKITGKKEWFRIPPWILVGSVVILGTILVFWTHENLNREKKFVTELMVEKGAALIRSFEAGTRTGMMGMMGMHRGEFRLQRLLMETARQPDIVYLVVTNSNGTILAGNDPRKIGSIHGNHLDLQRISHETKVQWREVHDPDGGHIFEVFRGFLPNRGKFQGYDWSSMCNPSGQTRFQGNRSWRRSADIIFVGLDMKSVEAARKTDTLHSIIMAVILFLIGFVGIFFLFLTQAYRTAKKTLTRVKAFSDSVVENMPIGLLFIDGNGRIVSFNQTAENIMEVSSAEVLGRNDDEVLPHELEALVVQCKSDKRIIEKEIDCPLENGRVVPMDIIVSPLEGDDDTFLGYIVLFRDLSEIHALKSEVERSRRLASLGKLAAGIAHEIRNPLSSIKGFATYFKERYRDVPTDQETADIMIQEVERLNRVIGQLLEFARPVSIEKKPTDIMALIQQSLKLVEGDALQRKIRVELEGPPQGIRVTLDPDRIKQVLLNLYLNALEAMGEGGILAVSVGQKQANMIEIEVRDTGEGISKEDLAHVFDPYFTRKPSGTGLGLAIVHKIMESHGGEVHVESAPGKGTTVKLSFPVEGEQG